MSIITIGFSKPKKWKPFAQLIMFGYGISYDHVYIKFYSEKFDRHMLYQASKGSVNFMSADIFDEENQIIDEFDVNITDSNRTKMIQFAIDNCGKPYGIKQAFGMGLVRLFEILGKNIKNPYRDQGKTYVCSELGAYVLEQFAGVIIPKELDDITPKDLYDYFHKIKTGALNGKT